MRRRLSRQLPAAPPSTVSVAAARARVPAAMGVAVPAASISVIVADSRSRGGEGGAVVAHPVAVCILVAWAVAVVACPVAVGISIVGTGGCPCRRGGGRPGRDGGRRARCRCGARARRSVGAPRSGCGQLRGGDGESAYHECGGRCDGEAFADVLAHIHHPLGRGKTSDGLPLSITRAAGTHPCTGAHLFCACSFQRGRLAPCPRGSLTRPASNRRVKRRPLSTFSVRLCRRARWQVRRRVHYRVHCRAFCRGTGT